jgi:hypothetical protein
MSKPSGTMRNPRRTNQQEETPRRPLIYSRIDALWGIDGAASQRRQAAFPEMGNKRRRRRRGRGALARGEARTRILGVRAVMLVQWRAAHVRAAQIGACGTKLRRRRPKRIAKLEKNTIIAFELNTKKKID